MSAPAVQPAVSGVALLFNPAAGQRERGRELRGIERALRAGGLDVVRQPTTAPGEATRLARAAVSAGRAAVFVLGGDGTVREAAAGLLGSDVPLGVLPGGTTNVVAHALGLAADDPVAAAARLAAHWATKRTRALDVGLAGGEPFLMQLSLGFDAAALARVRPAAKRRFGKLAVAWAGLRALAGYRFPSFRVAIDGEETRATGIVIANLPFYAGTYEILPGARADDGRLDCLLFRGTRRRAAFGFALDLARGRHRWRSDIEIRRVARSVDLLDNPGGAPGQIDGDLWSFRPPVRVALAPAKIYLLVP